MKKKLFAVTLILTLMMGVACFAATFTAKYNGATVTCELTNNKSKGTGKTTYKPEGYKLYVAVFGYGSDGIAVVSSSDEKDSIFESVQVTTNKNTNVVKYKGTHYIKDVKGNVLAKYTTEA